jgi:hypothetical protein
MRGLAEGEGFGRIHAPGAALMAGRNRIDGA